MKAKITVECDDETLRGHIISWIALCADNELPESDLEDNDGNMVTYDSLVEADNVLTLSFDVEEPEDEE